jgi:hypothetical protein
MFLQIPKISKSHKHKKLQKSRNTQYTQIIKMETFESEKKTQMKKSYKKIWV